jgi:V/A-type H+-transporting ATPase subunit C
MNSIARYAAVNTKIRALEGQFLTEQDYRNLFEMDNVADIVRYLKKTSLGKAFADRDASSLHRGEIEVLLKRYGIDIMEKLSNYYHGQYAKFIKVLFMRYEVEDLKVLLRAVYTDRDYHHASRPLIYIGRYGSLDFEKLASSKSYYELLENLKGSPYYDYLAHLKLYGSQEDKFLIEMALDHAYVSIYKKHLEHLSSHEKDVIYKLQGMRADLLNLQWIYRGKKFYRLAPELLFNYCIRFGGRLNDEILKDLCYSGSIEELEQKMSDSRYGFLFRHDRTKDIFMERRIFRYLYYRIQEYRRKNTMDIVQTVLFFDLLEFEIRDIITIVENIRYHNEDPDQIKRCLIREL